jgi:hypothetical protein
VVDHCLVLEKPALNLGCEQKIPTSGGWVVGVIGLACKIASGSKTTALIRRLFTAAN